MAYNFKNLAEVELLAEVPENATAFAEVDGVVKRVPSKGLGGEGGIKTAIVKDSGYDSMSSGMAPMSAGFDYECINMTFEEAYQTMKNGEPLACFGMLTGSGGAINTYGAAALLGAAWFDVPCIVMTFSLIGLDLYWTADGLSVDEPGSSGEIG